MDRITRQRLKRDRAAAGPFTWTKQDPGPGVFDNPEREYGYDSAGRLTSITMIIADKIYKKTFTYDSAGRLSNQSIWLESREE